MIKFCGNCGTTVTEKDIEEEKAYTSGKYVYCKSCASKLGFTGDGPPPNEEEIFNAQDNMATAMIGPDQVNMLQQETSGDSDGDRTTAVLNSGLAKRKANADGAAREKQEVECEGCGARLRIKLGDKPKKVRCPKCKEIFTAAPAGMDPSSPAPEPTVPTKDGTEQLAAVEPPSGMLDKPSDDAPAITENEDGVIDFPAPSPDPEPSGNLIDFNPEPEPDIHEESTGSQPVAPALMSDGLEALEPAIPDDPPRKKESEQLSALEEVPVEEKPKTKPKTGTKPLSSRRRRTEAPVKAASGKQKKAEPAEATVRTSRRSRRGEAAAAEKPERTSRSARRSSVSARSSGRRGGRGGGKASAAKSGKGLLLLLILIILSPGLAIGVLQTRERKARLSEVGLKAASGLSKIGLPVEAGTAPSAEPADGQAVAPENQQAGEEPAAVEGEKAAGEEPAGEPAADENGDKPAEEEKTEEPADTAAE